jgi:hypothetical protein
MIANYLTLSIILSNFVTDPVAEATKIANGEYAFLHEDEEEGGIKNLESDFQEILKGLNGAFTQSRAVEIGIQKLATYIDELRAEIISETNEVKDLIKMPETTLNSNITALSAQPYDIDSLRRRRDFYNSSLATKEYMTKKTIIALQKIYNVEVLTESMAKNILFTVATQIGNTSASAILEKLETGIKIYNSKLELLNMKSVNPNISFPEFDKLFAYDEAALGDNNLYLGLPSLLGEIDTGPIDGADKSIIDFVSDLIESLPGMFDYVGETIGSFKEIVSKVSDINTPIIDVVTDFKTNCIETFTNGTITKDEFTQSIASKGELMRGYNSVTNNLAVTITEAAIGVNKLISTYDVVGNLLDELTLYGTIESPK